MVLETFFVINIFLLVNRGIFTKIIDKHEVYHKIINEGLYHITTKENAEAIIKSGYFNPSSAIRSYGKKKVFFFAGIPNYMDIYSNIDTLTNQYEMPAVKLKLKPEELAKFKQRSLGDNAISYEGKCMIPDNRAEIVTLVLDLDKNKKVIVRGKEKMEDYVPSEELKQILKFDGGVINKTKKLFKVYYNEVSNLVKGIKNLTLYSFEKLKENNYKLIKDQKFYMAKKMENETNKIL